MKESKTTGQILWEEREKKGLLLRQVAAMLDIDTAILSKIERVKYAIEDGLKSERSKFKILDIITKVDNGEL